MIGNGNLSGMFGSLKGFVGSGALLAMSLLCIIVN